MRTPGAAFAWEFGRRHRWALVGAGGYLSLLLAARLAYSGNQPRLDGRESLQVALTLIIPLGGIAAYWMAAFSFGLEGDLAARRSVFPAGRFLLPVSTASLVGWPIALGAGSAAGLWLISHQVARPLLPNEIPYWPILLGPVILVWTQGLSWLSYPLRGLRVIATVGWLAVIAFGSTFALELGVTELTMFAILLPQIPIASLIAWYGVRQARRGEHPKPWLLSSWLHSIGERLPQPRAFSAPEHALTWYEWRRTGLVLPSLVALVLPFELSLLFLLPETTGMVFGVIAAVLITPVFLAMFVAASGRSSNRNSNELHQLPIFQATLPIPSRLWIAAKLRCAAASTAVAWFLIAIVVPFALFLSGSADAVREPLRQLGEAVGRPRALVAFLLVFAACVLATWKQLVTGLFLGVSGRPWLIRASVIGPLFVLIFLVPAGFWVLDNLRVLAIVWNVLPPILFVLVSLKVGASIRVLVSLSRRKLATPRRIVRLVLLWDLLIVLLFATLCWLIPDLLLPRYLLGLLAILAIPLFRPTAATLALASNRHR